jgi:hypothetical protein
MFPLLWVPKLSLCLSYQLLTATAYNKQNCSSPLTANQFTSLHCTPLSWTNLPTNYFTSLHSAEPASISVLLITSWHGLHRKHHSCVRVCCEHYLGMVTVSQLPRRNSLYATISTEVISVPLNNNSIFPMAHCLRRLLYRFLSSFDDTVMNTWVM